MEKKIKTLKFTSQFFFVAATITFVVAMLLLASLLFFIPVSLNGKVYWLRRGTTVEELFEKGYVEAKWGDLYDVEGKLLKKEKGEAPSVFINGKKASSLTTLFPQSRVLILDGKDKVERETVWFEEIEPPWRLKNKGALLFVSRAGLPGVKILTVGSVSGKVLNKKCLKEPSPYLIEGLKKDVGRVVALTFDDGPNPKHTPKILDILKKFDVKATFFVTGGNTLRYPQILERAYREEHEIGNHTFSHPDLVEISREEIEKEIVQCDEAIYRTIGVRPKCFRPPYGSINGEVFKVVHELGYEVALWSVATENRLFPTPKLMKVRVLMGTRNGMVVLAHDGGKNRENTIKALPAIIRELKERGFEFVTFSELVRLTKGVSI